MTVFIYFLLRWPLLNDSIFFFSSSVRACLCECMRAWWTIILVTFSLFFSLAFLRFPKRKKPHSHTHTHLIFSAIIRIHIGLMTISLFSHRSFFFDVFPFLSRKKWRKIKPFAITGKGEPRNNIRERSVCFLPFEETQSAVIIPI